MSETQGHLRAKLALLETFRARRLKAQLECDVLSDGGDRRADVLVWGKDGATCIAFEIQHSPLKATEIAHRTAAYRAAGVGVIWIGVLTSPRAAHQVTGGFEVPRFSAAPWQRWAHKHGGQRLWFFGARSEKFYMGRFKPALIEVPDNGWGGGYSKIARRWVRARFDGPRAAADLNVCRLPGPNGVVAINLTA